MIKEAKAYSLIRVLVDDADKALDLLKRADYWVHPAHVLVMKLKNRPGTLADISKKFGDARININYVYGSGASEAKTALYVFHVPNVDKALKSLSK